MVLADKSRWLTGQILPCEYERVKYIMAHSCGTGCEELSLLGYSMGQAQPPVVTTRKREERFDRSRRIPWFDLERTQSAHVLVVGAGALGNELVKNLVLSGVGRITLVDMDRVVRSNLNRCVFFSDEDAERGRMKVEAVAEGARAVDSSVRFQLHTERIEDLGEGIFEGVNAIAGCVDNLAARVHINANAYHLAIPYVDGGTLGLMGKVQMVIPPTTSCVECTLNASHYKVIEQRYSCTGGDMTYVEPKLASEVTTTAVVAAVQAREVMKLVNGREDLALANLFYYDGNRNISDVLEVAINPDCPNHQQAPAGRPAPAEGTTGRGG